ncbi:hypothetical protein FRB95_013967 [Tulasnella sp. JGI-2019a]|nr:hypothetical protein FRB95_013967 [Tulasnella sp. JGI-2019a]
MARNTSHKGNAKKLAIPTSHKLKKDPGIPKLSLLKNTRLSKLAQKLDAQSMPLPPAPDSMAVDQTSMSALAASAFSSSSILDPMSEQDVAWRLKYTSGGAAGNDPTMAAHAYQFRKVLDLADVVLQVLDARDPLGCRSKMLEEEVIRAGGEKKLILVLNKIDLVPKENVIAWLRYLRHSFPTIPFKSSTQQQRSHLSSSGTGTSSKSSKGTSHLLTILKSIRPAHSSITVGVLGAPNVGKSSLINSIKREKVCTVGAKPGETRALKEVAVERGIKVVDSPGIIWGDASEGGSMRNVWSLEGLEDPIMVGTLIVGSSLSTYADAVKNLTVEGIVARVPTEALQTMYGTPPFKDAMELLTMIALVRGKLGKGGKPDINLAAISVVHDWNVGKIPFFTIPPVIHPSMAVPTATATTSSGPVSNDNEMTTDVKEREAAYASTSIVDSWSKPFDLDGLWDAVDEDVLNEAGEDVEMQGEGEDQGDGGCVLDEMVNDGSQSMQPDGESRPPSRMPSSATTDPLVRSQSRTSQSTAIKKVRRERRPPKQPRERTQRLEPVNGGEADEALLMSDMNPMGRKNLKANAKAKRREAAKFGGAGLIDEDVDM